MAVDIVSAVMKRRLFADTCFSVLWQLERELEGMRTRGVDLSSKQREIEVARRSAEEAAVRAREAHKCVSA